MAIYLTGYERTLTVSDTFAMDTYVGEGTYSPSVASLGAFENVAKFSVSAFGCTVEGLIRQYWPSTPVEDPVYYQQDKVVHHISATSPVGSDAPSDEVSGLPGTPGDPIFPDDEAGPDHITFDNDDSVSASYTISVDVEECFEVGAIDSSLTDSDGFPNYGGSPSADGTPALYIRFFERLKVGGDITCTGSVAGVSADASGTITVATEIGHSITGELTALARQGFRTTGSASITGGFANNFGASYPGSYSYSGAGPMGSGTRSIDFSATGGSVTAVAMDGTGESQGGSLTPIVITPPMETALTGRLRTLDGDYSSNMDMVWLDHISGGLDATTTINANPGVSQTSTRYSYSVSGLLNSDPQTTDSLNDAPTKQRIALSNSEETADWRLGFLGKPFKAFTLVHTEQTILDDGSDTSKWTAGSHSAVSSAGPIQIDVDSSGVGSASRNFSPKLKAECYRYLRVRIASVSHDNQPFRVKINGKTWTGVTGTAGTMTDVDIDLCAPTTIGRGAFGLGYRWPLIGPGDQPQHEGGTWGVNWSSVIEFNNLAKSESYQIESIKLVRKNWTKASFVSTFLNWQLLYPVVLSGTDDSITTTTRGRPSFWGDVDQRKANDRFDMTWEHIDSSGSPVDNYGYLSITSMISGINEIPGFTATAATSFPSDGYHTNSLYAAWLYGGNGAYYDYAISDPAWHEGIDIDCTSAADIYCQPVFDEVWAYPGCGNVWQESGTRVYGVLPLAVNKMLRAGAWGIAINSETHEPIVGAPAVSFETANPSVNSGGGTTGSIGDFRTGAPYGKTPVDHTTQLQFGVTPYPSFSQTWNARTRERTGYGWHSGGKSLGYDVSTRSRHCRTHMSNDTGHIVLSVAGNNIPNTWTDVDTGISATWARPRFRDCGLDSFIGLMYGDGSQVHWARSFDEGRTWKDVTDMADGTFGDYDEAGNGVKWDFKLLSSDMGATFDVWNQLRDNQFNVMRAWKKTTLLGVDNAAIAVRTSAGTDGAFRVGVFYSIGGNVQTSYSFDGLKFT